MSGMILVDADGNRIADEVLYGSHWMRDRQNHWWQDLGMQDAGWTYEFFDGALLREESVTFGDGVVQPGGPGYQALIVYQEALAADTAALLLDWARQGLRVLIVNGARELRSLLYDRYATFVRAAARTPGLDGRDAELAETMAALRALPTVAEIDDPAGTVDALRGLGVVGRAEFTADNRSVLSYLREDGDLLHLFAYHFLYEAGEATEIEFALIVEDRGLGYETRELRPTTAVTKLESPSRALAPWKDLEGVGPDVSGVGEYVASFAVSAADIDGGRLVLDLGSTSGGLGSVRVNGSEPRGFDTSRPVVDVTDLVRDGANDLVVRVSSSLNNRLIARGYYDAIPDIGLMLANRQGVHRTVVRDYGLQGPVRLHRVG
jgi:hypothetical protein